ncbi:aminodeoxychorismate synthase component I [Shimia marina]|uniref:Para-aminobenzoate synthase component 1 n=1 Tax=Shimia marina TaxID=321267 RepID=A0A0P1ERI7_9RHOB|nr:aminodeoxychorismate synthase component I [Shimia marina]CUH53137.1 Para-aminobenzoate synthase component 1 [Shimia marina]SFD83768.1 aminodeoxychorismate synthase, subunit I [Shimia marina]
MQIRFDRGPNGDAALFSAPEHVISVTDPKEVPLAFDVLSQAQEAGFWLAGYASYELGYVLEPRLRRMLPKSRRLPLMQFGVFKAPQAAAALPAPEGFELEAFEPRWSGATYRSAFDRVHDYIGAGDIYQANLTFPMDAQIEGDPEALYAALVARQPVGHGALVQQEGLPTLLSRSPELFFRTDAQGRIETRPMKGTQPRSEDAVEDARRRDWLVNDEKNRAENLMIVDLLRNDISRVAQPGSVHVPKLFEIESYATVHQMTSTVAAQLKDGVTLSDILQALFPCGSITGAPKLRAMQILRDLEPWPRDIYCGTIGWAAPDGRSDFNVAIRTLMVEAGRAVLNVGGGVVWDSTAPSEYEEALWKARFARAFQPEPV